MEPIYLVTRTLSSIGDGICVEPIISLAHEKIVNNGEIWLQCDERIADFYREHPFVNKILYPNQQPPAGVRHIINMYDADSCPSIRSLMSGGKFNAVKLFCDAAQVDGAPLLYDGRAPKLYFTEAEKRLIGFLRRSIPKKRIAIQKKGGHWWKTYPHLDKLIKLLSNRPDVQLFLTHDDNVQEMKGVIPLIRLKYRDLMVWLGSMDLVIGYDSGVTHLSAAIGTRTYVICGPTDPVELYSMYGSHVSWNDFPVKCSRRHCWLRPCKKLVCLRALSPWTILRDVDTILAEGYDNPRIRYLERAASPATFDISISSVVDRAPAITPVPEFPGEIALMRLDGLGGTVTLSDQAKKLHEQTDQKVTLITRGYETLFEDNPHVEKIINVGMRNWQECSMVYRNQFDCLAEVRFGLGKWYSANGDLRQNDEALVMFEKFPINFNQLEKYGLHHIQLTDRTLDLPYQTIESKIYTDEAFDLGIDNFILINNGVDVIHQGMRQTKCWDGWEELVKRLDGPVIQCGTHDDDLVNGAVDLRGETTLKQLNYLIKKAGAIVVTEGGVMHLAFAAGNPNVVVLGGPTQGSLFQYPGHKWITSYICGNCWSTTDDWYSVCPKQSDAVCMKTIPLERVVESVYQIIE